MPYDVVMDTAEAIVASDDSRFNNLLWLRLALFIRDKLGLELYFEGLLSVAEVIVGQTLLLTILLMHDG